MKNKSNSIFTRCLKKYKWIIALYVVLYLLSSGCTIGVTIFSANTVALITDKSYLMAIYYTIAVIGFVSLSRAFEWIADYIFYKYTAKITLELNESLANQIFKFTSKTYSDHDTGTFIQRVLDDPRQMLDQLSRFIQEVASLVSSVVMVVYVSTLNVWLALLFVALVVGGTALEVARVRIRHGMRSKLKRRNDKVYSLTTEIVRSEKDIKSMGLEEKLSNETHTCYQDYQNYNFKTELVDLNFWQGRNILIDIATYVILLLGVVFIQKGLISIAVYMIVFANRHDFYSLVWQLGHVGDIFADVKVSLSRMSELFDETEFTTEHFGTVELPKVDNGSEIVFKDVEYGYKNIEYNIVKEGKKRIKVPKVTSENKVFENLSFTIKPNTTVAFVGESGSGKSTILNLISKLYEVDKGEVLINGENINNLTKDSLRKNISLVNQFPYIFNMSIKENLLLAKKDATDEDLLNALKEANLDEFVSTLPKGLDSIVGEGGIKLSGGQRQRLAIARALLRNSSIIIFDESTSSLDNFAQEEIKKSIDMLKGKSTIVIVAHRLSTIKNVDHIYFLDNGKIIDEGTFNELFDRNEKFKAMFLVENI